MEYRDLYDEYGNLTEETILKGEDYPNNRRILVAAIIIENSTNKLLVQKRSISKDGYWSFTSGHIEKNETCMEGIIRETKEELGLELSSEEIISFNSGINDKYVFESYYIKKDVEIKTLNFQLEEVSDAKWLSLDEIKNLIKLKEFKKSHIKIFDDYLKYFGKDYDFS